MVPSGKTFHLPSEPPARAEDPPLSGGYASDPESEVRRVKSPDVGIRNDGVEVALFSHEGHGGGVGTLPLSKGGAMTATYQELFRSELSRVITYDEGRRIFAGWPTYSLAFSITKSPSTWSKLELRRCLSQVMQ